MPAPIVLRCIYYGSVSMQHFAPFSLHEKRCHARFSHLSIIFSPFRAAKGTLSSAYGAERAAGFPECCSVQLPGQQKAVCSAVRNASRCLPRKTQSDQTYGQQWAAIFTPLRRAPD